MKKEKTEIEKDKAHWPGAHWPVEEEFKKLEFGNVIIDTQLSEFVHKLKILLLIWEYPLLFLFHEEK